MSFDSLATILGVNVATIIGTYISLRVAVAKLEVKVDALWNRAGHAGEKN